MSKGTSIKEAVIKWEQKHKQKVSTVTELKLIGMHPSIEKMDSLTALSHLEKLSLSTNCIEKITNLNAFKNLKTLSLGRNNIKSLAGLEPVSEMLEELWMSYNQIERLTGITVMKKLRVFYLSNNAVKDWGEFHKLTEVTTLEDLLFVGNPLEEKHSVDGTWRTEVAKRLPNLQKLDGVPLIRDNVDNALLYKFQSEHKDGEMKPSNSLPDQPQTKS